MAAHGFEAAQDGAVVAAQARLAAAAPMPSSSASVSGDSVSCAAARFSRRRREPARDLRQRR